jgi:FkbM family methyltransferase
MSLRAWLVDRLLLKQPRVRRALTRLLEGDRDLDIVLMHTAIHVNTLREHGYVRASRMMPRSSFLHDEASVLLALGGVLPFADAFIDIGANVGVYSKILHRFRSLYPHLRFHAFEADPDTARRLAATLRDTTVTLHPLALADQDGRLEFSRGAVSHVSTRRDLATKYQTDDQFSTECRRLDSCAIEGNRLILKIDVEGQEWAVLQGAAALFAAQRVLAVFLDGTSEPTRIADFLRTRDFILFDARTLTPVTGEIPYALLGIDAMHLRTNANPSAG